MALELKITIDDAGRTQVTGPIDQPIVAYGLLEVARDVIRVYNESKKNLVQPVGAAALHAISKSNGG